MPYIEQHRRDSIARGDKPRTTGELNYAITRACIDFLSIGGVTYADINDVIGSLESAKQEFYRRVAVPLEEQKRRKNGDVYPERKFA